MKKGWTMEFLLKVGCSDCNTCNTSGYTFDNHDIFFLMGTRAENKYWDWFSGETGINTSSGISLSPESGNTQSTINSFQYWIEQRQIGCPNYISPSITSPENEQYPNFDLINNVLAFRLDQNTNQIGYRKVSYIGVCSLDYSGVTSGGTHMDAIAVIEEKMSPNPIDISGTCSGETWIHVVVKFERQFTLTDCELYNKGGINDINYKDYTTYLKLLKYQQEIDWRKGKLVFYINGKRHFVVDDFEEIIPRQLDTHQEKQEGVPFNISWGGGTQGLLESITFDSFGGQHNQDYLDYQMLMERNFNSSWCGGYSVLKIYDKPLENFEIINNFCTFASRFSLKKIICCQCTPNNPYKTN
jgi:hypothetical protein